MLCTNEATHAQSWMVEGIVEDEVDEIAPTLEEVREVDEDDFVSDGEEDYGDDDDDDELELYESNKERDLVIEDNEHEEMELKD